MVLQAIEHAGRCETVAPRSCLAPPCREDQMKLVAGPRFRP